MTDPRTEAPRTVCGTCGHPMHWRLCGAGADSTVGPCPCRNDESVMTPDAPRTEAPDLRAALTQAAAAMDLVRDGLMVRESDAVVISAESILRHAAREARAALSSATPAPLDPEVAAAVRAWLAGDEKGLNGAMTDLAARLTEADR